MKQETRIKIKEFTDLLVWQKAHALAIAIYKITQGFPREETYGLSSQMRRAAISVTSNIAEGFGRISYKEKLQFYYLAHGSLTELKNQIILARDVAYLNEEGFEYIESFLTETHRLLLGFLKSTRGMINP